MSTWEDEAFSMATGSIPGLRVPIDKVFVQFPFFVTGNDGKPTNAQSLFQTKGIDPQQPLKSDYH
jgi:hypothetical protein